MKCVGCGHKFYAGEDGSTFDEFCGGFFCRKCEREGKIRDHLEEDRVREEEEKFPYIALGIHPRDFM